MTESATDRELLRLFAEQGSESAFKALVGRHLDLVYATALRGLNDPSAAQEVTQNVFVMLARKAVWLSGDTHLAAYLHKATLLEVRHWWRGEFRRRRREQVAAEIGTLMKDDNSLAQALEGELDEGLLSLRPADREALILRYIEGRSHREIGSLLGLREDAARMRVGKALQQLTEYFRGRGYTVPTGTAAVAALGAAAKAAPAGLAASITSAGLAAGGATSATASKLFLVKLMSLSKAQTVASCMLIAVTPAAWEWHRANQAQTEHALAQTRLVDARDERSLAAEELRRLQAESTRLDGAIENANTNRGRYDAAAAKLEELRARTHGLLADGRSRWTADLPYVRVPKAEVRALDLLHKPGTFGPDGVLNHTAQEMLGISPAEKDAVESALSAYWTEVRQLTEDNARRSRVTTNAAGDITFTVATPPLGEPIKELGAETAARISNAVGNDREELLFGDWSQGGIQVFAPGNLWRIGDQAQEFTVWVNPQTQRGGSGWHVDGTGIGSGIGQNDFGSVPTGIFQNVFLPWLAESGVTLPSAPSPSSNH